MRLLGLRGRAGEGRDWRERGRDRREGGGWIFPRETLIPSQFLTDLVPFPLDFPQENVPYLKENVRYLVFLENDRFLTFWTDFVPFPTFS